MEMPMADVSAVDGGRESRSGGVARDRAGAGTFSWLGLILTVVGTNIALGMFLWLVTDARFSSMESRFESLFASIESRLMGIESRLTIFESRLIHIDSRLAGIETPMSGAGAPIAADTEER